MTGAFIAQPGALISNEDGADVTCIGAEDVIVRAAEGVTADAVDLIDDPSEPGADLVRLRTQLAAVVRQSDPTDGSATGASERLARSYYRDLLGRIADASGASYWAGVLDAGTTPSTVTTRLLATDVARANLVRATWATWSCDGGPPTDDEVANGVEFLRSGGIVSVLRADVLAATVPDDGDPVVCLYHGVLDREPDAGGHAYAEARLEQESLERLARRYMVSSEGRRVQFNRLFQRLLGRATTADEVLAGTRLVRGGATETGLTAALAGATEYVERASI